MIADPTTGERVSYVPLYLQEGETSEPVTLTITPEVEDALLRGSVSSAADIMARIAPSAFQDIGVTPLDLGAYFGTPVNVEFQIAAADPLPGVNRVLLTAGIARQQAAAWRG